MNKFARVVTKWTQACDRRLAIWISHIHHTHSDSFVMCKHGSAIVDWVCSKTETLLATIRTRKQLRVESHVFSEAEHLFSQVGCARSKRRCLAVQQNPELFHWMLVFEQTGSLLFIEVLHSSKNTDTPTQQGAGSRLRKEVQSTNPNTKSKRDSNRELTKWITFSQAQNLLKSKLSCTFLKTMML